MTLCFEVPMHLPTQINQAPHWAVRARKVKTQRRIIATAWAVYARRVFAGSQPPYQVRLTRIGPRRIDDDNLQASCKAVRDEIAQRLGVDDGSSLVRFTYGQERGPWGIRVEVVGC